MQSLEDILLRESIQEATDLLTFELHLTEWERLQLNISPPNMVINDDAGVYASYNVITDTYTFSREAIRNPLAVGEEVAHRIRLTLNSEARNHLLSPDIELEDYVNAVNFEEYFGRYGALIYANHQGQSDANRLWTRINYDVIELSTEPFDTLIHIFGYQKAEEDFNNQTIGKLGFNRNSLYSLYYDSNIEISQLRISPQIQYPKAA